MVENSSVSPRGQHDRDCPRCGGSGYLSDLDESIAYPGDFPPHVQATVPCWLCNGTGALPAAEEPETFRHFPLELPDDL